MKEPSSPAESRPQPEGSPSPEPAPSPAQEDDLALMQSDYERYFLKREPTDPTPLPVEKSPLPVEKYPLNQLVVLGTQKGRLLCRFRPVHLEPSSSSLERQERAGKEERVGCPAVQRYWKKRYLLFERFDEGIQLDEESWFSVTPEVVAGYIAGRVGREGAVVLDGFCGAGGDSIQLAKTCRSVIANDLDVAKLTMLKSNAAIYGAHNITPSNSDFLDLDLGRGRVNLVYMSPPWGGPQYFEEPSIRPQDMQPPLGPVLAKAFTMTHSVSLLLAANMDPELLAEAFAEALSPEEPPSCTLVIEKIYFSGRLKFLLVLFGPETARVDVGDELGYLYKALGEGDSPFRHRSVIKRLREKVGMVRLLNALFECQNYLWKEKPTLYHKLEAHFLHASLLTPHELQELNHLDARRSPSDSKRGVKQRKVRSKGRRQGGRREESEERPKGGERSDGND